MIDFYDVSVAIADCKAIAFDTCHKIYVLMDDAQVEKMREYEYDPLITKDQMGSQEMLDTVKKWFDESCGLRFVQAVSTTPDGVDPNEGFEVLIEQGASDEEECEDCLEMGCAGACQDFIIDEEDEEDED